MTDVARLGTPLSVGATTGNFTQAAGSNRIVFGIAMAEANIGSSAAAWTMSYDTGGSPVAGTLIGSVFHDHTTVDLQISVFYILEADLPADGSIGFSFSGPSTNLRCQVFSYENCDQAQDFSNFAVTDTDASTPNPMTGADLTISAGSFMFSVAASGSNGASCTWGSDLTEQLDDETNSTGAACTMADAGSVAGGTLTARPTFSAQNRACMISVEVIAASGGGGGGGTHVIINPIGPGGGAIGRPGGAISAAA